MGHNPSSEKRARVKNLTRQKSRVTLVLLWRVPSASQRVQQETWCASDADKKIQNGIKMIGPSPRRQQQVNLGRRCVTMLFVGLESSHDPIFLVFICKSLLRKWVVNLNRECRSGSVWCEENFGVVCWIECIV